MRKIFILSLLTLPLFLLSSGFLDSTDNEALKAPFKLRSDIHDYLKINEQALDPLEGFWSLNIQRTLYDYNAIVETETEPNRMGLAIIKEDDFYRVYDGNENSNFIGSFSKTTSPELFNYHCYFINTKDFVSAIAYFKNKKTIEYEYDVPDGLMKHYYAHGSENEKKEILEKIENGTLRLNWKFTWLKYDPYEQPEKEWANHGKYFHEMDKNLIF